MAVGRNVEVSVPPDQAFQKVMAAMASIGKVEETTQRRGLWLGRPATGSTLFVSASRFCPVPKQAQPSSRSEARGKTFGEPRRAR